ncbi:MAG: hypothetical protein WDN04_09420 [Rhodospirillales bacterium]
MATLTGLTASSGLLIFDDAADFSVIGSVTATGDVTLASVGALTQSSGTIASSGGDVSVTAGRTSGSAAPFRVPRCSSPQTVATSPKRWAAAAVAYWRPRSKPPRPVR